MIINEETLYGGGSRVYISQNAWQDTSTSNWYANDDNKDSFLIEMVDSATDQGYISIQHAPKTAGVISWTEVFRMNHDGSVLLNKVASLPDAPGADIFKMFAENYLGRLVPMMRTASETVNLLQGVGTSRVIRATSFPGSAKEGDILFKPGSSSYFEKEIRIPIDALGTGASKPSAVTLGDYAGWSYGIGDDSIFQFEIPHDWNGKSALELYGHLYIDEAYATNNGYINWQLDYSCTPEDASEPVDSPTHSGTVTSGSFQIPATAKTLMEAGPVTIPLSDIADGDVIGVTFTRIANDGGQNNPTAEPVIIGIELEYQVDKPGY